jgi:hypothetical protein
MTYDTVLGCPRSGTTFLMHVFNTVPEAECISGIVFSSFLAQLAAQPLPPPIYEALQIEFEMALHRYLESGMYRSRASALQKWASTRKDGLSGLLQAFKGKRTETRMIFKEPFLSFVPEYAYQSIPNSRIIHIYRDGRDCADSLARTYKVLTDEKMMTLRSTELRFGRKVEDKYIPWWVEEGLEEDFFKATPYVRGVWMWRVMVRRCHDFFSRPDVQASGRVLLLRYEDLMREPAHFGQQVADHLGLTINTRFRKRLMEAHTKSVGVYKKRPSSEIAAANRIAEEELKRYGYEVW